MATYAKTPIAAAVGAAFLASVSLASVGHAAENPFHAQGLDSGYNLADKTMPEGKCGEGKCGESMRKAHEGNCGADKAKAAGEGKCGADKAKAAGEGKCGADKAKAKAAGEGKCGGDKAGSSAKP